MTAQTSPDLLDSSGMSAAERRKAPRYGFVAVADLTDPEDGKLVSGRVSQISRSGCYVESPKTFPVGTSLKVIVFRDEHTFVAKANIIHVQEQMGMGIAFVDPLKGQLDILDSWLAESASASPGGNHRLKRS